MYVSPIASYFGTCEALPPHSSLLVELLDCPSTSTLFQMATVYFQETRIESLGFFHKSYVVYRLTISYLGHHYSLERRYSSIRRLWKQLRARFPDKESLQDFPRRHVFGNHSVELVDCRSQAFNHLFALWSSDAEISQAQEFSDFLDLSRRGEFTGKISTILCGEESWRCKACGTINEVAFRKCRDCLAPISLSPKKAHRSSSTGALETKANSVDLAIDCPITGEVMVDAVSCVPCGHSFSELGIQSWLRKDNLCPICRNLVKGVIPNYSMRNLILQVSPESQRESRPLIDKAPATPGPAAPAQPRIENERCSVM